MKQQEALGSLGMVLILSVMMGAVMLASKGLQDKQIGRS